MDIFNTLTPEALVDAIAKQMQQLIATGGDDVVRLRKELEKTPNDIETWFNLGLALNQAGLQYEDLAVRLAELRFSPDFQDENMMPEEEMPLLKVEVSEGNVLYTEALQAFDHVLELDPDYYGVACQKGVVYGNLQDYENAEKCYLKALQDDEEDFSAAYYLSLTYRDMGKDDLADKYLQLADQLNDGEPLA